jgi:hypothetical protein
MYIGALFESILEGIKPENLPLDIVAHGSLLYSERFQTSHLTGAVKPWPPTHTPDSVVLYGNALSVALASANVTEEHLFACVRVTLSKGLILINPPPGESAQAQMLLVCTERGPHFVQYDTCSDARTIASQHYIPSLRVIERMLNEGVKAATQALEAQEKLLEQAELPWSSEKWPSLLPSSRAMDVLEDLASEQMAKLLNTTDLPRAQQLLTLSKIEV